MPPIGLTLMLQVALSPWPMPRITPRTECPQGQGEVVVCGRRDAGERYRIPPQERGPAAEAEDRGNGLSGSHILAGSGPCGLFAGQRRCSHGEAVQSGYGGGRDPMTLGRKILTRLADPDADIDPPPPPPPAGR